MSEFCNDCGGNDETPQEHCMDCERGPATNDQIRRIFVEHGFTIKPGCDDLKPYVYAAARALIDEVLAQQAASLPKPQPVFWYRKSSDGGIYGPISEAAIEDSRRATWTPLYESVMPGCYWCDQTVKMGDAYHKGLEDGQARAMKLVADQRGDALLVPRDVLLNLIAVASMEMEHINMVLCPDAVNGHGSRDQDCPACRAIAQAESFLAGGDA